MSEVEKKKKMVKKLVQLEIEEDVAKAAVQAVGFDDVDNCMVWALSPEGNVEELALQYDDDIGVL